jgi:hypothetical protein
VARAGDKKVGGYGSNEKRVRARAGRGGKESLDFYFLVQGGARGKVRARAAGSVAVLKEC